MPNKQLKASHNYSSSRLLCMAPRAGESLFLAIKGSQMTPGKAVDFQSRAVFYSPPIRSLKPTTSELRWDLERLPRADRELSLAQGGTFVAISADIGLHPHINRDRRLQFASLPRSLL